MAFTGSASTGAMLKGNANLVANSVRVNIEADSLNASILGPAVDPGSATWQMWLHDGVRDFHVFGWGPVVVRRYLDGEQLVWEYTDGSATRMDRICTLPDSEKIPEPRGCRVSLF